MSSTEIDGLKKLRTGSLIIILAPILILVGVFVGLGSALAGAASGSVSGSATGALAGVTIVGVVAIVGIVLEIFAIYLIRKGFGILKAFDPQFGIGGTGALIALVASILLILAFIGIIALILPMLFLAPIAGILYFIGVIMMGIGFHRVGGKYDDNLVSIGGILLIFIPFIGAILNVIGLGRIINKLGGGFSPYSQTYQPPSGYSQGYTQQPYGQPYYNPESTTPPTYPPTQPNYPPPTGQQPTSLPYQTGTGRLYSNGVAELTIYSPYRVQVIQASIVGTSYATSSITPNYLEVGNNNIRIYFSIGPDLKPYNTYTIQLYLSTGQAISAQVTYS
ncbi:DUF973 family protein [Stygiolobus caldivivus]|uniref:DUF973 family protein n=1 Tax=Stygiolobus caldivivus TaxID=2824673 RepID=A0A8D5ZJ15_9CREN|nr:DUF973 family protein [Stygiolobus caldivivus]BCU69885.1 hypothetical protein KN1_11820 [Stygiolobus caldivivus]